MRKNLQSSVRVRISQLKALLDLIIPNQNIKMSTTTLCTALFLLAVLVPAMGMEVDFSNCSIQSNTQWTRVKLAFSSAVEPVQIFYNEYPVGWNEILDYMYVPADQLSANRKYPIKIKAIDANNTQFNSTIVYVVSDSKVYLSNISFPYDQIFEDSFYDSGIFKGKPQMQKASTASNVSMTTTATLPDAVDKLSSISETPGAGIADYVASSVNMNQSLAITNVGVANQMREDLRSNLISSMAINDSSQSVSSQTISSSQVLNDGKTASNNNQIIVIPANIQQTAQQTNQSAIANYTALYATQLLIVNDILQSEAQQANNTKTIEAIFAKLPGPQELDTIILSADSVAIVQTIQRVIESVTLNCQQKMSYLSDFFGRIQSAISMKAFAASQLNIIIQGAQTQIARLTALIEVNKKSIKNLGIAEVKAKLNQQLVNLQNAYTAFNNASNQLEPKYEVVNGLKVQIADLALSIDYNTQQINAKQVQLSQVNGNIAVLEQQLAQATAKRDVFQSNIQILQNALLKFDAIIADDNAKINATSIKITQQLNQQDEIKIKYQKLQISVERQRTQIANREIKQAQLTLLISSLQTRAVIQKKKMDTSDLNKVKALIKSLQATLPNIQQQVDDSNFRCNQLKQTQIVKQGDVTIFSVIPQAYNSYLQACYQSSKIDSSNLKAAKITITPLSILDQSWQNAYGNPYTQDSYLSANDFSFNQDFNCLNPSSLETGFGTISKINNKFLEIDSQGKKSVLNLGSCSRMESVQPIPKIGQKIYFRGTKTQNNIYNVYKASCL